MDWYVCRGCGEADDIARITPTIRPVTSIRIEDGALTADLGEAEQVDDVLRPLRSAVPELWH
jgi:hypothetical protein